MRNLINYFRIFIYFFTFFCIVAANIGCNIFPFKKDPFTKPFPFTLKEEETLTSFGIFYDLNQDGYDEFITMQNSYNLLKDVTRLIINYHNSDVRRETNFSGIMKQPFIFDWTGNGIKEVLVPYVRNDSLFIKIIDFDGKTLVDTFLLYGKTLYEDGTTLNWLGTITKMCYKDIDNDGLEELIVFPTEGRAKNPRGVIVFDGTTFKEKWQYLIGPPPNTPHVFDFNNDGFMEFLIPTSAPENDNIKNGMDDKHSYLLMLDHKGDSLWCHEYGGSKSAVSVDILDMDNDGDIEIIALFSDKIHIIDYKTGRSVESEYFDSTPLQFKAIQTDKDNDVEFVVSQRNGKLNIIKDLKIIREMPNDKIFNNLDIIEDLDGDHFDEICLSLEEGIFIIDRNFNVLTKHPMSYKCSFWDVPQLYHRHDHPSLIALFDLRTEKGKLFSLHRNPFYLLELYGPLLICILLILLMLYYFKTILDKKYYKQIIGKLFFEIDDGLFLLDSKSRIHFCNSRAEKILNIKNKKLPIKLKTLSSQNEDLKKFILSLLNQSNSQEKKSFQFEDIRNQAYKVEAKPFTSNNKKHPDWMIWLKNQNQTENIENVQSWVGMAQRIAHDIKNPLTSIQLTLQRLQREYRLKESSNSLMYDSFTSIIMDRIEALRRLSREFLKFLNLEKSNFQNSNLNVTLEELFSDSIFEIPKDILLKKNFKNNLPAVDIDQEQFISLVENLLTNAINAMPDGGTLTISTNTVSNTHLNSFDEKPRDYVVLEIMDTGKGISKELQEKLFQPYISKSHLGTGLGLTIVKKIVDDHHGIIEFHSEEGVGTSFIIYFPVSKMKHSLLT